MEIKNQDEYFVIEYESILTGEKKTYMNIGFSSFKSAEDELGRILKEKEKYLKIYNEYQIRENIKNNIRIPTSVIGINFKILPKIVNNKYFSKNKS